MTLKSRIRDKVKASPSDLASDFVVPIEWALRSGADGLAVLPEIRVPEVAKIIQERRLGIMAERKT